MSDVDIQPCGIEYGVETMPGVVVECESEQEAREKIARDGGTLVAREWFISEA